MESTHTSASRSHVQTVHTGFDDAKVREFIPLLVERKVRAVLAHRQTSLNWTT